MSATMLVPCSIGGWRRIHYVTQPTGGVGWWFDRERPGTLTPDDLAAIGTLVEAEVARRQAKWRRAQEKRRSAAGRAA